MNTENPTPHFLGKTIRYAVADAVFERHPSYRVGVLVARNVRNGESQPPLVAALQRACADLRESIDITAVAADHRIHPWREAFRAFGARPSDFRPSVEALARRAIRGSLSSLGRLIDIGTVISLRHLVPIGGHALDDVDGDIMLRLATGGETFSAFGSTTSERPIAGEVILAEGNTVLTRRWVWRQSEHTAIKPNSRNLLYNVDVLPDLPDVDAMAIAVELAKLVAEYAGGQVAIDLLDATHRSTTLTF